MQAKEPGADLVALQADVDALTATMQSIAASAQINGINMVDNTTTRSFAVSLTRVGAGDVGLEVLDVDGVDLDTDAAADVTLVADAADETDVDAVETQLQAAISAAAAFGSAQTRIDAQNELPEQADGRDQDRHGRAGRRRPRRGLGPARPRCRPSSSSASRRSRSPTRRRRTSWRCSADATRPGRASAPATPFPSHRLNLPGPSPGPQGVPMMTMHAQARSGYAGAATPIRTDRGAEYAVFARVTHRLSALDETDRSSFPDRSPRPSATTRSSGARSPRT